MEHLTLQDAIVFLIAAGLIVPLFKSWRVSPVLGFIIVGVIVGPYGIVTLAPESEWLRYLMITDQAGATALAELGVIFLLFLIGLDLSFARLWAMRKYVLGLGSTQILVTATVITIIALAWGNTLDAAIVLGGCLALSSTAIVLQLLVDQGRFSSPAGHASFAVLLAQDLAVVPLLFLVGAFASTSAGTTSADFGYAFGRAALALALIALIGHLLLKPLFRFVGKLETPELFMATTLLVVIATAALTHAAGLSAALGAFLAGLLLSESEYRHDIELYIDPFKGLLLGLFFMSVAMAIDLSRIADDPVWIGLSVIGLLALKTTITTICARTFGLGWPLAAETGLLLSQGGEFAFVVISLALSFALLPDATAQFMLIVVSVTMFATPFLATLSRKIGDLGATTSDHEPDVPRELSDHVILVGHGRTGQLLSQMLNQQKIPFVTLDRNPDRQGQDVHIGDATRTQTLQKFQLLNARALVVCIDVQATAAQIVSSARRIAPDIPILVRCRDEAQATLQLAGGATVAVPEVLESGLQLASALLDHLDVPDQAAGDIVAQLRHHATRDDAGLAVKNG
jgi:CPA2 family monovalent cation:H+ antiporter-2